MFILPFSRHARRLSPRFRAWCSTALLQLTSTIFRNQLQLVTQNMSAAEITYLQTHQQLPAAQASAAKGY